MTIDDNMRQHAAQQWALSGTEEPTAHNSRDLSWELHPRHLLRIALPATSDTWQCVIKAGLLVSPVFSADISKHLQTHLEIDHKHHKHPRLESDFGRTNSTQPSNDFSYWELWTPGANPLWCHWRRLSTTWIEGCECNAWRDSKMFIDHLGLGCDMLWHVVTFHDISTYFNYLFWSTLVIDLI